MCVFKSRLKVGRVSADVTECGRAFQARAAVTGNARSPSVEQRLAGTNSCDSAAERRCRNCNCDALQLEAVRRRASRTAYQIFTQSGNAQLSYWWFMKFYLKCIFLQFCEHLSVFWYKYVLRTSWNCYSWGFRNILTSPFNLATPISYN